MTGELSSLPYPPSALILAAGESRRFWPLSSTRHKTLFELGESTILERTVVSLSRAGVREVVILQSPRELYSELGNGVIPSDCIRRHYGATNVTFVEQPQPAGQGDAILRCADLLGDSFFMVQPENINAGEIAAELMRTASDADIAVVAAKEREDFPLYAVIDHAGSRLTAIVEKPQTARTDAPLCGIGIYLLHSAFLQYLSSFEPDPTSLILALNDAGSHGKVSVANTRYEFLPLKYPAHLWQYARFLQREAPGESPSTAPDVEAEASDVSRCIVSRGCIIEHDVELSNAILAPGVFIGAGTKTAARGQWRDVDAVVIGEGATIGPNVTLNAGVRVGAGATIAGGLSIAEDVPDMAKLELDA